MESILGEGEESHFVQPPLLMGEEEEEEFSAVLHHRNMKEHIYPRRPAQPKRPSQATTDYSPSVSTPPLEICTSPSPQFQSTPGADTPTRQTGSEGTRGHARDPLEEEMPFLHIGPSNFGPEAELNQTKQGDPALESGGIPTPARPSLTESPMIVSESPPAADIDIYETAYKEIIERITSRSREAQSPTPKVYLNRRVEKKATASSGLWSQVRRNSKLSGVPSPSAATPVPDSPPPRPRLIKRFTAAAASFAASSGKQAPSPSPLATSVKVNDVVDSDKGIEPSPLDTPAAVIETTASPTALSPVDDAKKGI